MRVLACLALAGCVSDPGRPACTALRTLAELNAPEDDHDPWLAPDRTEIVFASKRPGAQQGEQLWHAVRAGYDGPFGAPTQLTGDFVSSAGEITGPSMSDDGLTLYYTMQPFIQGVPAIYQATRADRASDHFDGPQLLVAEGNHASLTADGLTMYFAKGTPSHLFRTTRAALDAPFELATRLDELAVDEELQPSISGDDATLVFAQAAAGPAHIVRSRRGAAVFGPAQPVVETELPDPAATVERPSLHRDGVTIVFSSDITGGSAAEDLFITCE